MDLSLADSRRHRVRSLRLREKAAALATSDRGNRDDGLSVFHGHHYRDGRAGCVDLRVVVVRRAARLLSRLDSKQRRLILFGDEVQEAVGPLTNVPHSL